MDSIGPGELLEACSKIDGVVVEQYAGIEKPYVPEHYLLIGILNKSVEASATDVTRVDDYSKAFQVYAHGGASNYIVMAVPKVSIGAVKEILESNNSVKVLLHEHITNALFGGETLEIW